MAGTFISYQGLPAQRAVFRRSRGYASDWSFVDIPVTAFSGKFKFKVPKAGDGPDNLFVPKGPDDDKVDAGRAPKILLDEELPSELDHWGALTMAEVDQEGKVFRTDVNLYVAKLETIRETFVVNRVINHDGQKTTVAESGSIAMLRIHLVDVRYFWPRGVLRQWSFNRPTRLSKNTLLPQPVISYARDSVKSDGTPFTKLEVAKKVVSCLFGRPLLDKAPISWDTKFDVAKLDTDRPIFTFERPPFDSAVEAFRALCQDAGVEEPILRLDDQVEIRESGDGAIAPAADKNGVINGPNSNQNAAPVSASAQGVADTSIDQGQQALWNRTPLDGFRLWKGGEGQSTTREPQYPEDVVIVVGKPIVATVAIDDWEPVLLLSRDDLRFLPGTEPKDQIFQILPLTDATVRLMTSSGNTARLEKNANGKLEPVVLGLDWLRLWILAPEEHRHDPAILPQVLDIFRRQAWRFWRMPGLVEGNNLPGPNANLLPLLPRAEVEAGQRMPISVERFGYAERHLEFSESSVRSQIDRVETDLGAARDAIRNAIRLGGANKGSAEFSEAEKARLKGSGGDTSDRDIKEGTLDDPFGVELSWVFGETGIEGGRAYRSGSKVFITPAVYLDGAKQFGGFEIKAPGFSEALYAAIEQARQLEHIAATPAGSAASNAYEILLRRRNDLYVLDNGGQPLNELLDLGKKLVECERTLDGLSVEKLQGTSNDAAGAAKKAVDAVLDTVVSKARRPATLMDFLKNSPIFLAALPLFVRIDEGLRSARREMQVRRQLHQDGGIAAAEFGSRITHRNLPRKIDGRARIVDAELGIVETSEMAGHLANERYASTPWDGRPFVPRPVRVIFGVTVRPGISPVVTRGVTVKGELATPVKEQTDAVTPENAVAFESLGASNGALQGIATGRDQTGALNTNPVVQVPALSERGKLARLEAGRRLKDVDRSLQELAEQSVRQGGDGPTFRDQIKILLRFKDAEEVIKDETASGSLTPEKIALFEALRNIKDNLAADLARIIEGVDSVIRDPGEDATPDLSMVNILGGQDVASMAALTDFETYYWKAWKVKSRDDLTGKVEMVQLFSLSEHDRVNSIVVRKHDLEALYPLGRADPTDANRLLRQTKEAALGIFQRPTVLHGGKHLFARPWPINCDGRVAFVEIRSIDHEGAPCGFETLVTEGSVAFNHRIQTPYAGRTPTLAFTPFDEDPR